MQQVTATTMLQKSLQASTSVQTYSLIKGNTYVNQDDIFRRFEVVIQLILLHLRKKVNAHFHIFPDAEYAEYDEAATMEKFRREARREADRERMESDARGMFEESLKPDVIARVLKTSIEDVERILGLNKG